MTAPPPPPVLAGENIDLIAAWDRASEPERRAFRTARGREVVDGMPSVDLFLPLDPWPLLDLDPWPLLDLDLPPLELGLEPLDLGALAPLEFGLEPLDRRAEHVTLEAGGRAIVGAVSRRAVSRRKGGGDGPKDAGT